MLAAVQRQEARTAEGRGRLKIFLGMAPGVGKTYAMLSAAQRLAQQGVDVAVGVVECHGRTETEQMLLGLDIVPRRAVDYRGATLHEFDLDAALRRRPEYLLVDELAHTNAPGCRFAKRWEDIAECLRAGIHVFTTLNVQHIESLNDVVAQVTGVRVRETVPDAVVDDASEVELVDLPPDSLLERLKAGKVYLPESARAAADQFFRTGNLTALRELALRRTAEWVDARLREFKEGSGIRASWHTSERIIVAVSASPVSARVVRAARRMAAGLHAELIAVYVEQPGAVRTADRDRALATLRLAEQLGAETTTLTVGQGESAARRLVEYARSRHVNRIVVGKTGRPRWREGLGLLLGTPGGFVGSLVRLSGDLDIFVTAGDVDEPAVQPASPALAVPVKWGGYAAALGIVGAATAVALLLYTPPDLSEEAMMLLAAVVLTAMRFGRGPAAAAAFLAVACFNFFFTEPRFSLSVRDPSSLVTFAVMLAVGLVVGGLAARLREQSHLARARERRTSALYALARDLSTSRTMAEVAQAAAQHARDTFGADAAVAVRAEHAAAGLDVVGAAGAPDWLDQSDGRERGVARWALDHRAAAGAGTQSLPASTGRFIPLTATQGTLGVLCLRLTRPGVLVSAEEVLLLDSFANQIALAMERVLLIEAQRSARMEAEGERLRSALLSSVSHDLRTPLASIAGAASTLLESGQGMADAVRHDLTQTILSEANRLNKLIANLVFATRLEAGIQLRREWTTVEEIIGAGLAPHRQALAQRPFRIGPLDSLPMVRVDNAMMPQVVANLVENALRHTPPGTALAVQAWVDDNQVVVAVSDEGAALTPDDAARLFQRPLGSVPRGSGAMPDAAAGAAGQDARAASAARSHASQLGLGLGLHICRAIVEAHQGRIWAESVLPRGVSFRFSIPVEPQPEMPAEPLEQAEVDA